VTLTTTGSGDILPASPRAAGYRAFANLEAMIGVLYIAILGVTPDRADGTPGQPLLARRI
jgi:hypothetical protein